MVYNLVNSSVPLPCEFVINRLNSAIKIPVIFVFSLFSFHKCWNSDTPSFTVTDGPRLPESLSQSVNDNRYLRGSAHVRVRDFAKKDYRKLVRNSFILIILTFLKILYNEVYFRIWSWDEKIHSKDTFGD